MQQVVEILSINMLRGDDKIAFESNRDLSPSNLAPTVAGSSKDIIGAPGADSSPDSLHQLSNGLHSRALKKTPLPIKDDDSNEEILPTFFFPIFSNGLPNIMTVSKL